jgi:uncharacterized membrane protein
VKSQILKTVWINLIGIFVAVYLSGIITEVAKIKDFSELGNALQIGLIGGLFGVLGYGLLFWVGFIILIIPIELIFMSPDIKRIKTVLVFEWLIISIPFIYC